MFKMTDKDGLKVAWNMHPRHNELETPPIDVQLKEQVEEAWVALETLLSYSNKYNVSFVDLLISMKKLLS